MRTLILSCDTGEGHNSCARAIKEVYTANNSVCDIEDALCFIKSNVSSVMSKGHIFFYRHLPKLFNWGYSYTENHPAIFSENSVLYNLIALGSKKLHLFIQKNEYDVVICTHPFAAVMLTEARNRYGLSVKTAFVATDYSCCPSVKDSNLDYYFIPDKGLEFDFVCENIPKEKIIPSGIPVRQSFFTSVDKRQAKEQVGVSPNNKHIVVMSGSMGCGPMEELVEYIYEKLNTDCELTVICGTNERLQSRLEERFNEAKNIHIKGFVTNISTVMDSADVYLTKPGGISTTEAAVKGLPMLFIDAVAACETYNLLWFAHAGVATGGETVEELAEICLDLLDNEEMLVRMKECFVNLNQNNAAKTIYEHMTK